MELSMVVNGLEVEARYGDAEVEQIFMPLLKHLTELWEQKGSRVLVMLAAPPAAGKSTLAAVLEHLSQTLPTSCKFQSIGMDGFHRHQSYLDEHYMERNGERVLMARYKGAPETFDLELLRAALESVASGEVCGWPAYDRTIHDPLDDAVTVDGDIVLVEGNYLLLDEVGWRDLAELADYTITIVADPEFLRDRLVDRKSASGIDRSVAEAFVQDSDLYNARTVLKRSQNADLMLELGTDGTYRVLA
jgi:pantothenate kinase